MVDHTEQQKVIQAQAHTQTDFDYELVTINHHTAIDPGDEVLFDLYISGYGSPPKNKLTMLSNPAILPDSQWVGKVSLSVDGSVDWNENRIEHLSIGSEIDDSDSHIRHMPLSRYGITMGIPRILFADDVEWGANMRANPDISMDQIFDKYYPRTLSEKVLPLPRNSSDEISEDLAFVPEDGESEEQVVPSPPMRFKLNTSEQAKPGDYEIRLILAVGDDEKVETISETVNVHVNTTREQLEPLPTGAAVVGAIIALLSLVHATGVFGLLFSLLS